MKQPQADVRRPSLGTATVMVFFTTFALLFFQILQAVTLSLQLFYNTAFLVISLCMFGLGGGGSLAFFLEHRGHIVTQRTLWRLSLAYACSLVGVGMLNSRVNDLGSLILTGFLPYLFAGVLLSMTFRTWPEKAGRIYFFDLLGSGFGALTLVLVLNGLGDAGMVQLVASGIALMGTLACAAALSRRAVVTTLAVALGVAALFPWSTALFPFQPGPDKTYGTILRDPQVQSTIDWTRWSYLGRLDSVIPGKGVDDFGYFGDWVRPDDPSNSETRLLFASGDNWSSTVDFKDDDAYRSKFLKESVPAAPYIFLDQPDVLNIGLGGGIDVFIALSNGARRVVGVEINPLMIEAHHRHRRFFDDPFHDARVTVHEMDGRTFVNRTDERFDLITLTAVDTGAGLSAGAYVLSENYLYTQEAFDAYLSTLKRGGIIFVYRPELGTLRILATAAASLRKRGVEDPEKHLAVFGGGLWKGTLIGVDPLPSEKLDELAASLERGEFGGKVHYLPGMGLARAAPFASLIAAIGADREGSMTHRLIDFSPVSDDRPFFYHFDRDFFASQGGRKLLTILALISTGATLLIVIPLLGIRGKVRLETQFATLGFFSSIGLGFMLVEVALIQKLVLFLGHPAYSMTVTLFVLLVFSGLGSIFVDRFDRMSPIGIASIVPGILIALLFYAFGLGAMLESSNVSSLLGRATIATVFLAPGSFLMGMLLPSMIRWLGNRDPVLISWAWGVNALASVVASILAVIISMTWGFTGAILCGALCYVGAAIFSLASGHATAPPPPRAGRGR